MSHLSTAVTDGAPGAAVMALGPISHVALTVRDLAVSVPWYQQVIGSEPVLDEDTGPFRHVVFAVGGTLLGLHEFPGEARSARSTRAGRGSTTSPSSRPTGQRSPPGASGW